MVTLAFESPKEFYDLCHECGVVIDHAADVIKCKESIASMNAKA